MRRTPACGHISRELLELAAVGRERELVQGRALKVTRQGRKEPHDVLSHERLAARDANLSDAFPDECGAQAIELFEREKVGLRQERHVLRHAIDAAEVAAIGDRNPQIGDVAPERIDHGSAGWLNRVCGEMLKGHRRRPNWD